MGRRSAPVRRALLLLLAACTRAERPQVTADETPPARPSVTVAPSAGPVVAKSGLPLTVLQQLPLTRATHGVDGRLDVYGATEFAAPADAVLVLVPASGPTRRLTFEGARNPSVKSVVYGDAKRASLLLQYEAASTAVLDQALTVVEIEGGELVTRVARNATTFEVEPVRAEWRLGGTTFGVSTHDGPGRAELLTVICGAPASASRCRSTNRVFYVRDQQWWWGERAATSCTRVAASACVPDMLGLTRTDFPPPI